MITFDDYRSVLADLTRTGVRSQTVSAVIEKAPAPGTLYLKHDVEARIDHAVRMAEIEHQEGHQATYYFQADLIYESNAEGHLRAIKSFGHEIAYHYDVLDAHDGDYASAIREFDENLAMFSSYGCDITTVCPHGNPTKIRTGWISNKDFFRSEDVRARYTGMIDIVIDFPEVFKTGVYLSDAGLALRIIDEISENDRTTGSAISGGARIEWDDVAQLAKKCCGLVLSAHPHRFHERRRSQQIQRLGFYILKKSYKTLGHIPMVRKLASKSYKLTRKI